MLVEPDYLLMIDQYWVSVDMKDVAQSVHWHSLPEVVVLPVAADHIIINTTNILVPCWINIINPFTPRHDYSRL